ncbi:MAG: glycosyl hydrolase family 28-related protein [Aeromonadaceae bacterium]
MTQRVVNYTYGTGNPVLPDGSVDVRDGIDNLQSMDVFMNAPEDTYNQRDGEIVQTVAGAIRSVGFKPGGGDFTTGFTVSQGQRDYAWYDPVSHNWYSYLGVIPVGGYVVSPATNPVGNANWKPVTDQLLRNDLADSSGSSKVGFIQSGSGSIPRTAQDKMRELVSVKDFGAVGDGATDDTAAIRAAINALTPAGGVLHFPKGYYLISDDLKINNIPIIVRGDGMMSSQIIQTTSGKNGFTFTSNTPSNAPVGGGLLLNTFQIEDISINRGAGTGGSAIGMTWTAMTSNTPQFIARNLRTYSKADAANAWAYAISGFNMNGLRMSTCQLHGNPLQGGDAGAEPFTMKAAIRLINTTSDTTGLISFFMDKVTALYCNIGLEINGWHEGFQLNEIEFVQVGRGIVSNGSSAHQNPDMLITNSHIDARVADIDLNNVFKLRVANCDFIKNDASLNGACIRGVSSGYASIVGTSFTCIGTQTATNRAIDCDLNCFNWTITGCHFLYFKDGAINNQSSGWVVTSNQFDDSPTAIAVFGVLGRNIIANNAYRNVANPVIVSGSTNNLISPIEYVGTVDMVVGVAGALQGAVITIPTGIFTAAPDVVTFNRIGGSNNILFSCSYNKASSSATSIKLEVTGSALIPTGTYTFGFVAKQKFA